MQKAGVRPVVDAHSLAVVEVVTRKLLDAARAEHPDVAILTDSPDFHLSGVR
jgi:hypothetical protein